MSSGLRITLEKFSRMVAQGAFNELGDRHIELIYGELREMVSPGPSHINTVRRLNRWSHDHVGDDDAFIMIQDPIGIAQYDSAPRPDVTWVKPKDYETIPQERDVLLLIEVSDTTLSYDTGEKLELYAFAAIKDYWVVNLQDCCVEVYRRPKRGRYLEHCAYRSGEQISPLAFPKLKLSVSGLFRDSE